MKNNFEEIKFCNIPKDFKEVFDSKYNLAILQRNPFNSPSYILEAAKRFTNEQETQIKLKIDITKYSYNSLNNFIPRLMNNFFLKEYIDGLVDIWQDKLNMSGPFSLRFEVLKSNTCVVFHQDNLNVRLLSTLVGPGTQYTTSNNINYSQLDEHWDDVDDHNNKIIKDKSKIFELNCGDIAVLKGLKSNSKKPIVHRSPPIENTSEKRLFISIDDMV